MGITIVIDEAEELADGIFEAPVEPAEVRRLGQPRTEQGEISLVFLSETPCFAAGSLKFNHANAEVMNLGSTSRTVLMRNPLIPKTRPAQPNGTGHDRMDGIRNAGDVAFIEELSPALRELGESLLTGIRALYRGSLRFHPRSGKFVETPVNFFTIKIQPRDKSLRVTVYGRPEDFTDIEGVTPKNDMTGYSAFKVRSLSEIESALSVIRRAELLKSTRS